MPESHGAYPTTDSHLLTLAGSVLYAWWAITKIKNIHITNLVYLKCTPREGRVHQIIQKLEPLTSSLINPMLHKDLYCRPQLGENKRQETEQMNGQVVSSIKNELTALNKVQNGIEIFLFSLHVCVVYTCENACPYVYTADV